ncbi:MAG TPA: RagB/SusD family nutrient uptake outer membrane protein [Chitinophagaceae bacterium]|jgi:hypothetical protein|nr:RagB/SusD family nutrient uptake outer membrane protein [Chitinophagaceae bacterium]
MKFSFRIFLFSILAVSVLAPGCKKALEIDPRQSIDADLALTTKDGIIAAITGVYDRLKSARLYGRDLIALPEALSDNGVATNKSGRFNAEAANNSGAHFTTSVWQINYAGINDVNLILEALPGITDATAAEKASWEGQLLFLRALYHFDLVKVYAYMPGATVASQDRGGIPILLKGTKGSAEAQLLLPSRAPVDEVYAQIVKDFQDANSKLPTTATDVSLANKAAVQGLLSRVNLYRKNYTETKRWADSAISTVGAARLSTASTYVADWRAQTHRETLFQVRYTLTNEGIGVNESTQTSFTTLVTPGGTTTGGFGDLVPSISLLNDLGIALTGGNTLQNWTASNHAIATRSADVRNLLYEPGTTGRGARRIETTKFIGKNGAINLDNSPVIRIAEVYLNRAEAMATTGSAVFNATAALADLNTILTNRGLTASALSGTALYEEILRQRRIELAFEGHRFFDLKRLGRDIVKGPHYNDVAFTDFRILPALPQREIDANTNLRQNFGY